MGVVIRTSALGLNLRPAQAKPSTLYDFLAAGIGFFHMQDGSANPLVLLIRLFPHVFIDGTAFEIFNRPFKLI